MAIEKERAHQTLSAANAAFPYAFVTMVAEVAVRYNGKRYFVIKGKV